MPTIFGCAALRLRPILAAAAWLAGMASLASCGSGSGGGTTGSSLPPPPPAETWRMAGMAVQSGPDTVGLIMAEVVTLSTGSYRLYYGAHRVAGGMDIWLAESADATTWQARGVALAGSANPSDPDFEVAGASVQQLDDGRWRMYYQATPSTQNGATPRFQVMSAVSTDGRSFVKEGVRIPSTYFDQAASLDEVGHTRVLKTVSGYLAYVSGHTAGSGEAGNAVFLFASSDGLTFGAPIGTVLTGAHDPYIVNVGGTYLLYVDSSPETGNVSVSQETLMASFDPTAWSRSSISSASFVDASGAPLRFGGGTGGIGDIAGVVVGGKLRLFSNYNAGPTNAIAYYDRVP